MANMDTWRLSRIEEELERLDIAYPEAEIPERFRDSPEQTAPLQTQASIQNGPTYTKPEPEEQEIYSKAVINPAHGANLDNNEINGVKKISDKYDSLGKVKPFMEDNIYVTKENMARVFAEVEDLDDAELEYDDQEEEYPPVTEGYGNRDKGLTEQDVVQVEMFYRSHKSEVFVCQCAAQMYFGKAPKHASMPVHLPGNSDNWTPVKSGIPLLILDSGESRRNRKLSILLAERGTGFMLWRDIVNHLTHYREVQAGFHAMHLSNDHTAMAGWQFDDAAAASDFLLKLNQLTSDPDDAILNLTGKSRKKKDGKHKRKGKYRAPTKSDISTPCCFTHVTNIDRSEGTSLVDTRSSPRSPIRALTARLSSSLPRGSKLIPTDS